MNKIYLSIIIILLLENCRKQDGICEQCNSPIVREIQWNGKDTAIDDQPLQFFAGYNIPGDTAVLDTLWNAHIQYTICYTDEDFSNYYNLDAGFFNTYCKQK